MGLDEHNGTNSPVKWAEKRGDQSVRLSVVKLNQTDWDHDTHNVKFEMVEHTLIDKYLVPHVFITSN